jgi:hypothetical protein
MPQRDDKVSVDFGRISSATWERLGEFPASTVEKAIPLLVKARSEGRVICSPATLKRGLKDSLSKKLWLMPETAEILNRISDETGLPRSSLILAALDLYFEGIPARSAPSGGSAGVESTQSGSAGRTR